MIMWAVCRLFSECCTSCGVKQRLESMYQFLECAKSPIPSQIRASRKERHMYHQMRTHMHQARMDFRSSCGLWRIRIRSEYVTQKTQNLHRHSASCTRQGMPLIMPCSCLLYTSDAADE